MSRIVTSEQLKSMRDHIRAGRRAHAYWMAYTLTGSETLGVMLQVSSGSGLLVAMRGRLMSPFERYWRLMILTSAVQMLKRLPTWSLQEHLKIYGSFVMMGATSWFRKKKSWRRLPRFGQIMVTRELFLVLRRKEISALVSSIVFLAALGNCNYLEAWISRLTFSNESVERLAQPSRSLRMECI